MFKRSHLARGRRQPRGIAAGWNSLREVEIIAETGDRFDIAIRLREQTRIAIERGGEGRLNRFASGIALCAWPAPALGHLVGRAERRLQPQPRLQDVMAVRVSAHAVLRARHLPAESYLDTGNRAAFANAEGAVMVWSENVHAPLALEGAEVEAARSVVLEQAEWLGWRQTLNGPDLIIEAAGRTIVPRLKQDRRVVAAWPAFGARVPARVVPPACRGVGVAMG